MYKAETVTSVVQCEYHSRNSLKRPAESNQHMFVLHSHWLSLTGLMIGCYYRLVLFICILVSGCVFPVLQMAMV